MCITMMQEKSGAAGNSAALDEERRATWLSTRQMEDDVKELVFLAIQEVHTDTVPCSDMMYM